MIIENRKIYKSDDGKEFATEAACLAYEQELAEKRKAERERKFKAEKKQKDYDVIVDSIKKFNEKYNTNHRLWVDDTSASMTLFDLLFK